MAYSLSDLKKSVHGDERVYHGIVTADATSGAVAIPGVSVINNAQISSKSSVAGLATIAINATTGGTASNGSLHIKSATSGDEYYVTVYGR